MELDFGVGLATAALRVAGEPPSPLARNLSSSHAILFFLTAWKCFVL